MSKPITQVDVVSFRGATVPFDIVFQPDKDLTMLFGENGTGKSSIIDAIDVVCNGGLGGLEGVSAGRNPGQYLCSVGKSPTSLKASVHSGSESWHATMTRNSIHVSGPAIKPKAKILRRGKILSLVTAVPSERYKVLKNFIDIEVVEQSENALQQQIKDVKKQIELHTAQKGNQETQLNNVWNNENRPGPGQTAIEWAKNKIDTGIEGLKSQLSQWDKLSTALEKAIQAKVTYQTKVSDTATAEKAINAVEEKIKKSPGIKAATAMQLVDLLTKAKTYIVVDENLDKCPTCLRPIDRKELTDIVDAQLNQMTDMKALHVAKVSAMRQMDLAQQNLTNSQKTLVTSLQELETTVKEFTPSEVEKLKIVWPNWSVTPLNYEEMAKIAEAMGTIQTQVAEKKAGVQKDVNQFNSIKEWAKSIQDADEQLKIYDRILKGLQQASDIVHNKRVAFTQSILDGIAQEANRLFQIIHPNENIGLEKLKMDEEQRSSILQTGVFHGETDVPPQAVFSESHMDTLGFCVWLALAKRENPQDTILLIDDVFTSVDASHLGRICDLLAQEGQNFLQIIVATHYRLWWDRCRNAQGIQRIQLGQWTVIKGICAQNMPLITQELYALANASILDRQAVSSKAGILLESVLDDLALLYGCSLPRNRINQYTLDSLIGACGRLFSKHKLTVLKNANWNVAGQPENWEASDPGTALERITKLQFIRNQVGCHFNPPGMEIPDAEVREFGLATVDLVAAMTCPNCGYIATKVLPDGTALRCSCKKQAVHMTPVTIMP
jgi:hypothetical protein